MRRGEGKAAGQSRPGTDQGKERTGVRKEHMEGPGGGRLSGILYTRVWEGRRGSGELCQHSGVVPFSTGAEPLHAAQHSESVSNMQLQGLTPLIPSLRHWIMPNEYVLRHFRKISSEMLTF